jgi:hypothetical protein
MPGLTDKLKLQGGKRKNGHKGTCECHICKNMEAKAQRNGYTEDIEREKERKNGLQKKNGHKLDCGCPICKNMKNKKNLSSPKKSVKNSSKKSNGHKLNCGCPICKNMKKRKGGGDDKENDDIVKEILDDEKKEEKKESEENVTIDSEKPDTKEAKTDTKEAKDDEYDDLDSIPSVKEDETPLPSKDSIVEKSEEPNINKGGTRKRKGKKSNGHKLNCGCPICKNMRNGKKTRKNKRRK